MDLYTIYIHPNIYQTLGFQKYKNSFEHHIQVNISKISAKVIQIYDSELLLLIHCFSLRVLIRIIFSLMKILKFFHFHKIYLYNLKVGFSIHYVFSKVLLIYLVFTCRLISLLLRLDYFLKDSVL